MDRGAWQATVHGVARVGHDLAITPPPVVRTLNFYSRGRSFIPGQGTKIPQAVQLGKKQTNKKHSRKSSYDVFSTYSVLSNLFILFH